MGLGYSAPRARVKPYGSGQRMEASEDNAPGIGIRKPTRVFTANAIVLGWTGRGGTP